MRIHAGFTARYLCIIVVMTAFPAIVFAQETDTRYPWHVRGQAKTCPDGYVCLPDGQKRSQNQKKVSPYKKRNQSYAAQQKSQSRRPAALQQSTQKSTQHIQNERQRLRMQRLRAAVPTRTSTQQSQARAVTSERSNIPKDTPLRTTRSSQTKQEAKQQAIAALQASQTQQQQAQPTASPVVATTSAVPTPQRHISESRLTQLQLRSQTPVSDRQTPRLLSHTPQQQQPAQLAPSAVESHWQGFWYGGFGLGASSVRPSDVISVGGSHISISSQGSHIGKLFAGYQMTTNLAIEAAYADLGESSIPETVADTQATVSYKSLMAGVVLYTNHLANGALHPYVKFGIANNILSGRSDITTKDGVSLYGGVGARYAFDNQFLIGAEIEAFSKTLQAVNVHAAVKF